MNEYKKFAIFILSHGRANNLYTYDSLIHFGYTGKIYILIDNEDKSSKDYYKLFGKKVIMFDKKEIADKIDVMDNFNNGRKAIVYARNACFKIAKDLGIEYFMQFDDDYIHYQYKFDSNNIYKGHNVKKLDNIIKPLIRYFKSANIDSIAFAQGGDFIGGGNGELGRAIKTKRKCMNSWLLKTSNPINFVGKMNEDYTASVYYGSLGKLFLTVGIISVQQKQTQSLTGGMSDIYKDNGTYVKTFYSIMIMPSCVKVSMMGISNRRIHHATNWNNAVPKIISEDIRKVDY